MQNYQDLPLSTADKLFIVATVADLPVNAVESELRWVSDVAQIYVYTGTTWQVASGGIGPASINNTASVNLAIVTGKLEASIVDSYVRGLFSATSPITLSVGGAIGVTGSNISGTANRLGVTGGTGAALAAVSLDVNTSLLPSPVIADANKFLKASGADTASWQVLGSSDIPNLDAAKITSGTFDIARIPAAAIERLVIVADQVARYALTTLIVQNGDSVKQTDTNVMYMVYDDTQLNNAAGYVEYAAGTAAAVAWTGITSKPDNIVAIAAMTGPGFTVKTSTDPAAVTYSSRSIVGTANRIGVTNGDGVSGNPTINLDTTQFPQSVLADASKTLVSSGANTAAWGVLPIAGGGTNAITAPLARQSLGVETVFNGLEDPSLFAVTYNTTNRQFTVTYTLGAAVTVGGVRYTKTGSDTTTAHANTTGQWYCYYDPSGAITVSSTPWDLLTTAPVAGVYYTTSNAGGAAAALIYDERHGGVGGMDNAVHKYLHSTRGTQLLSGIVASGFTLNTNGLANTSYALSAGSIADEDIILATAPQLQGGANTYRILYQTGTTASPVWNWVDQAEGGILSNGTNVQWNQLTGGNWQLTPIAANGVFMNYWVIATSTTAAPQVLVVMGQATYASQALANAATPASELSNLTQLTSEAVIVYQMTYQRNAAFGSPGNIRLMSATRVVASLATVSAGFTTTANAITTNTGAFNGILSSTDVNVQIALDTLDDYMGPVAVASNVTLTRNKVHLVDTTAPRTLAFPALVPGHGSQIVVKDVTGTADTNNITITQSAAETIEGVAASYVMSVPYGSITFYSDGTNRWII